MEIAGRHVVVTGAASGIGRALAARCAAEGARHVTVADRDAAGAAAVAAQIGGSSVAADVTVEDEVLRMLAEAEAAGGPVDILCSNAGMVGAVGGEEIADDVFEASWRLHVMAHLWAARALVPGMRERGEGYLLITASAAGLLANVRSLPYSLTKHAAVALAEWLSIAHHHEGIRSSALCPLGVRTPLLLADATAASEEASGMTLEPEEAAALAIAGLREERCLILTHPEVATWARRRADDHERWLAGMRRVHADIGA